MEHQGAPIRMTSARRGRRLASCAARSSCGPTHARRRSRSPAGGLARSRPPCSSSSAVSATPPSCACSPANRRDWWEENQPPKFPRQGGDPAGMTGCSVVRKGGSCRRIRRSRCAWSAMRRPRARRRRTSGSPCVEPSRSRPRSPREGWAAASWTSGGVVANPGVAVEVAVCGAGDVDGEHLQVVVEGGVGDAAGGRDADVENRDLDGSRPSDSMKRQNASTPS